MNNSKDKDIYNKRIELNITRKEFADALNFTVSQEKNLKFWECGQLYIPDDIYDRIIDFPSEPPFAKHDCGSSFTMIDLFAGIGGIRLGFQMNGGKCLFSSEWDKFAQKTYRINFGELPAGDITLIDDEIIPRHDILLAGFPCQPFSQAGLKKGFADIRGTLFFDVARIIKSKRPKAFMLENVKQLKGHANGETLKIILQTLRKMHYYVPEPKILNAYHFGVPQNRERIFIVGFDKNLLPDNHSVFIYPVGEIRDSISVGNILERDVLEKYTISDKLYAGHLDRKIKHQSKGNGFGFSLFNADSPYTSTISARYYKDGSEALIDQGVGKNPRMLTPRECARLQGFPDHYIIPVSNAQAYKQFGNSVCINVIEAIAKNMLVFMRENNLLPYK